MQSLHKGPCRCGGSAQRQKPILKLPLNEIVFCNKKIPVVRFGQPIFYFKL